MVKYRTVRSNGHVEGVEVAIHTFESLIGSVMISDDVEVREIECKDEEWVKGFRIVSAL
jgi:hypothetical protein